MIYGDIIHPEILKALSEAGHGTNIVIADGNFSGGYRRSGYGEKSILKSCTR